MSKTDNGKAYRVIITCIFTQEQFISTLHLSTLVKRFYRLSVLHRLEELPGLYFLIQANNWWALMLSFRRQCGIWITNMRRGLKKTFDGSLQRAEHHGDKAAQSLLKTVKKSLFFLWGDKNAIRDLQFCLRRPTSSILSQHVHTLLIPMMAATCRQTRCYWERQGRRYRHSRRTK